MALLHCWLYYNKCILCRFSGFLGYYNFSNTVNWAWVAYWGLKYYISTTLSLFTPKLGLQLGMNYSPSKIAFLGTCKICRKSGSSYFLMV